MTLRVIPDVWQEAERIAALLPVMLSQWRADDASMYHAWFVRGDRARNTRAIRRKLRTVISEIQAGRFTRSYQGSSLEGVISAVSDQSPIFETTAHLSRAMWTRQAEDDVEDRCNRRALGRFLRECSGGAESVTVRAIRVLESRKIEARGPVAANLVYFLHPTRVAPFNASIVRGYNFFTGANAGVTRWEDYLEVRRGMLLLNSMHRLQLADDLGAIAAFFFDVGTGYLQVSPRPEAWGFDPWGITEVPGWRRPTDGRRCAADSGSEHSRA